LTIQPEYGPALYALSRALAHERPEESKELQARFLKLQSMQRTIDQVHMTANDPLNQAARGNVQASISGLKAAMLQCGNCSAAPQLHKDLGLVYCKSGDLQNGESELLLADKLMPVIGTSQRHWRSAVEIDAPGCGRPSARATKCSAVLSTCIPFGSPLNLTLRFVYLLPFCTSICPVH